MAENDNPEDRKEQIFKLNRNFLAFLEVIVDIFPLIDDFGDFQNSHYSDQPF